MTLWDAAVSTLLEVEGGWVHDPNDAGGATNYGISQRSYPHLNIKTLTRDHAIGLYEIDYWNRVPDGLPDDLRWMAFDTAVHSGVGTARKWLEEHGTLTSYTAQRLTYLSGLGGWMTFGRGWTRRVAHVLSAIDAWVAENGRREVVPTVALHGLRVADRWVALTADPVVLRGRFVIRSRAGKVDVRRER